MVKYILDSSEDILNYMSSVDITKSWASEVYVHCKLVAKTNDFTLEFRDRRFYLQNFINSEVFKTFELNQCYVVLLKLNRINLKWEILKIIYNTTRKIKYAN